MRSLVEQYFNEYVNTLGDLETFNHEPRIVDHFKDGNMVRFHIEWFDAENDKPQMVEIHVTIRNTKNKIYKRGWVYRKDDGWEIQNY